MNRFYLRGILLAVLVAGLTAGCGQRSSRNGIMYGTSEPVGDGSARTWVQYDNGRPQAVGIRLSEDGLDGLPTQGGHEEIEYVLQFPEEASDVPFTHAVINWNPMGHEPEGIYTAPHFDFHFYTITEEERAHITPADPAYQEKLDREPSHPFMPIGYMSAKDGIPRMGRHWVDAKSPELHGAPFTRTMILGSYDGRMIFIEPMVTRDFLAQKPDDRQPIVLPERFEKSGYYPTEYSVRWDDQAREYVIGLDNMKLVD